MSFHKKVLIAFIAFHAVVTAGGLLAGLLLSTPEPTNDQDMVAQGVWPYVWIMFWTAASVVAVGAIYLVRAVIRVYKKVRKSTASA
jgi:hypothetical protein